MPRTVAALTCNDPARLLRRLCNHWRHKFEIERQNDEHARIPLGEVGTAEFVISSGILTIQAHHDDAGQLPRLKEVIANHLQRFAHDEPLVFAWRDGE